MKLSINHAQTRSVDLMKIQHNHQTKMYWVYVSTSIARLLGLNKGDNIEFVKDEKTNKVEFRKVPIPENK